MNQEKQEVETECNSFSLPADFFTCLRLLWLISCRKGPDKILCVSGWDSVWVWLLLFDMHDSQWISGGLFRPNLSLTPLHRGSLFYRFNLGGAFFFFLCTLFKCEWWNGIPCVFVGTGEGISKEALRGLRGQPSLCAETQNTSCGTLHPSLFFLQKAKPCLTIHINQP